MVRARLFTVCIPRVYSRDVSIAPALLGLLQTGPRHGYDLKRAYDERFGQDRPLAYGQVYATLARLLKNGLVEVEVIAETEAAIHNAQQVVLWIAKELHLDDIEPRSYLRLLLELTAAKADE